MSSPQNPTEEIFHRLLDETAALLAVPESAGIAVPDDELHREIIVPLLPAMLGDNAIRGHWSEQTATGFPARLTRHFDSDEPAPRWMPGDFEIHVTASYSAGADARALADTLLSEESLRDLTAALMNQFLDVLWPKLAPAPASAPAVREPPSAVEAAAVEVPETAAPAKLPATEAFSPAKTAPMQPPSRALIRALCREIPSSALQRRLATHRPSCGTSAPVIARRISGRAAISRPRLPRRASL